MVIGIRTGVDLTRSAALCSYLASPWVDNSIYKDGLLLKRHLNLQTFDDLKKFHSSGSASNFIKGLSYFKAIAIQAV